MASAFERKNEVVPYNKRFSQASSIPVSCKAREAHHTSITFQTILPLCTRKSNVTSICEATGKHFFRAAHLWTVANIRPAFCLDSDNPATSVGRRSLLQWTQNASERTFKLPVQAWDSILVKCGGPRTTAEAPQSLQSVSRLPFPCHAVTIRHGHLPSSLPEVSST